MLENGIDTRAAFISCLQSMETKLQISHFWGLSWFLLASVHLIRDLLIADYMSHLDVFAFSWNMFMIVFALKSGELKFLTLLFATSTDMPKVDNRIQMV